MIKKQNDSFVKQRSVSSLPVPLPTVNLEHEAAQLKQWPLTPFLSLQEVVTASCRVHRNEQPAFIKLLLFAKHGAQCWLYKIS